MISSAIYSGMGYALQPVLRGASALPGVQMKPQHVQLPKEQRARIPPSTKQQVDQALKDLRSAAQMWAGMKGQDKANMLRKCMWALVDKSEEVARLSVDAKGSYGSGLGEELNSMFPVVLGLREYIDALEAGGCVPPIKVMQAPGAPDQLVAEVFPWGMMGALLPGWRGEVWMLPGKPATQGELYRKQQEGTATAGAVSLVLGAGNQYPVVLLDILHKLVAEGEVVCVKMSPVNEYLGPVIEQALSPLVEAGVLRFTYGDREVGEYLTHHPLVDSIHLTGSAATCNAIVWGSPNAPRVGEPPLKKHVTAELGNVTPFIIVPGPWSDHDIELHAQAIASGLMNNASHNCLALEALVMPEGWQLRPRFLEALKRCMAASPQRVAYYPGSAAKYAAFRNRFADTSASGASKVVELGWNPLQSGSSSSSGQANGQEPAGQHEAPQQGSSGALGPQPWLLVEGLTPEQAHVETENWCGVVQEIVLPCGGGDPVQFMQAATKFANERCWGSLAAAVFCHPRTQAQHKDVFDAMIRDLRYGSITVNASPIMGFCITALPWGAAPGNTLHDVESGIGWVHNTRLFDHVAKGVLHVPWNPTPKPLYFVTNAALQSVVPPALRFTASLNDNSALAMWYLTQAAMGAVRG